MSPSLSESPAQVISHEGARATVRAPAAVPPVFAYLAWHSLAWLVFANAVGVVIATLLVAPRLDHILGEWTYGRWMPVHINLQLYGWCSIPLLGFLFKIYGADRAGVAQWCRPALWIWSTALTAGAISWLTGHSSGKLFLDWTGYTRVLFPLAIAAAWCLLAFAMFRSFANQSRTVRIAKIAGLLLLLLVPFLIYIAASPDLYPPINPDTGGPTGASQLESTLVVIAILLLLPFGLTHRTRGRAKQITIAWSVFAAEVLLCLALGRTSVSHHRPIQYISLGSLLVWLPLIPAYYRSFHWHPNTRRWRIAFLCWWSILLPTGWCLFLPGILDRIKFTDGLVAHSLLAMGGFATSLLIFVLVQLLGEKGWIFDKAWPFYLWQASVLVYVALLFFAGWREGIQPAFVMTPGVARNTIYVVRLLLGSLMLIASADWLIRARRLLRER